MTEYLNARRKTIDEYLPKLLKSLLESEEEDAEYTAAETMARDVLRSHRTISVNSKDIQHRVDQLVERLEIENLSRFGDYVRTFAGALAKNPLCMEHGEVDIQWAIMELLIQIAECPVQTLSRDRQKFMAELSALEAIVKNAGKTAVAEESPSAKQEYWRKLLARDNIPDTGQYSSDSELSNWSEDEAADQQKIKEATKKKTRKTKRQSKPPRSSAEIEKFKHLDCAAELQKLNLVCSEWRCDKFAKRPIIDTNSEIANFALVLPRKLTADAWHLVKFDEPFTLSEYCLLRELVFMFLLPTTMRFFKVCENGDEISVQQGVSITSVSEEVLYEYLSTNVLPLIRRMQALRQFIAHANTNRNRLPQTLCAFADCISSLLQPFTDALLAYERRLLQQQTSKVFNTLIAFEHAMREEFELLNVLHEIVCEVVLEEIVSSPHIYSMYLIARLYETSCTAIDNKHRNYRITLLLASLQGYCNILDTWWTKNMLVDVRNEFIVECEQSAQNNASIRPVLAGEYPAIATTIEACPLYHLFCAYVNETIETQRLLCMLGLMPNVLEQYKSQLRHIMHDELIQVVLDQVHKYHPELAPIKAQDEKDSKAAPSSCAGSGLAEIRERYSSADYFILDAMLTHLTARRASVKKDDTSACKAPSFLMGLFDQTSRILPLHRILSQSLEHVFSRRVCCVNEYVVQLYAGREQLFEHMRHIRNILLLEANYFLEPFFFNFFNLVETGQNWANGFALSTKMDDIITANFSKMSNIVSIEICSYMEADTRQACTAIDNIKLVYNITSALSFIVTPEDIENYNKIFRLLLKVKWALWKLQQLLLIRKPIKVPYTPLNLIDYKMRRLERLRSWLLHVFMSLHFYLLVHTLLRLSDELSKQLTACTCLQELQETHRSYMRNILQQTMTSPDFEDMLCAFTQMFYLVDVLVVEWQHCVLYMAESHALSLDIFEHNENAYYTIFDAVCKMEDTYVTLHKLIANALETNLTTKGHSFLSCLHEAITSRIPKLP